MGKSDNKASSEQGNDLQDDAIEVNEQADSTEPAIDKASEETLEEIAEQDDAEQGDDLEAELASAQEEITKLKDAFLRAKAEQDNVRRRSEKEVANSRKFAVEGFAKEMLNVYDSLNLAASHELADDASDAVKGMHEGVELTLKQLNSAFAKFALVAVTPEVGDKLDPNVHQAMSMLDSDEVESGCIINIIQAGFTLHDRLLRPALVVVAK